METIDPTTNKPLPPDAIQRVLFIAPKVHVYNIPPLTSTKGYVAASWTENNNARQIFTARLRILETAIPDSRTETETVKTDILLEDPATGQLFAAAPYTSPTVVEQVLDSSRFFAIRVQGEGGRKAVLGIGFEERSEAFDFSVTLQEVRKVQGMDEATAGVASKKAGGKTVVPKVPEQKDFSLKEGETITINLGGRGRRHKDDSRPSTTTRNDPTTVFSIAPPPSHTPSGRGGAMPFLPPPPSAAYVKSQQKQGSQNDPGQPKSDAELGFDDGEFGEFQ